MKKQIAMAVLVVGSGAALAHAQSAQGISAQQLAREVTEGCANEIKSYCSDVTPGDGRILACLYAREDKLTAQCEYALYDSSAQLQRMISALTYVASECADDLEKYCAQVPPGQGNLLQCLESHGKELDARCEQARKDTEAKQ